MRRNIAVGDSRCPAASAPSVAVIIVNYRTADLAVAAVDSLFEHPSASDLQVHVIDNASPCDDAEQLRQAICDRDWTGLVHLHRSPTNVGFGRANNAVLAMLQANPPEYVLLLNPDARVRNDVVARLRAALDADPNAAFAGPLVRHAGTGALRQAAFRFPHLGTVFQKALESPVLFRRFPHWEIGVESGSAAQLVDWMAAACVLVRYQVLSDLGGFDPRFFLYWEEVDLMHRGQRAGWRCWHVPLAQAEHVEGASTGFTISLDARRRMPAHFYQSWRIYFLANRGRSYALAAAALWLVGAWLHIGTSVLRKRQPVAPSGLTVDILRYVIGPLVGTAWIRCRRRGSTRTLR